MASGLGQDELRLRISAAGTALQRKGRGYCGVRRIVHTARRVRVPFYIDLDVVYAPVFVRCGLGLEILCSRSLLLWNGPADLSARNGRAWIGLHHLERCPRSRDDKSLISLGEPMELNASLFPGGAEARYLFLPIGGQRAAVRAGSD